MFHSCLLVMAHAKEMYMVYLLSGNWRHTRRIHEIVNYIQRE